MTIAAGIIATDGVLLFSDSQFSGWEKVYRRKIFSRRFGSTSLSFVLSGDDPYGRTAIEDSFEAVFAMPEGERSVWSVRKSIRRAIRKVLEDYDRSGRDHSQKPEFIIAIGTYVEGIHLFSTSDSSMPPVEFFDFRGSGSYLAQYLMHAFGTNSPVPLAKTIPIAIHVLNATKLHDSAVGGGSQFTVVRRITTENHFGIGFSEVFQYQYNPAEAQHITMYEHLCGALLSWISDRELSKEDFDARLKAFNKHVKEMRKLIAAPGSSYRKLMDSLIQEVQLNPQSTTTDPLCQPPSPESPGGSGES